MMIVKFEDGEATSYIGNVYMCTALPNGVVRVSQILGASAETPIVSRDLDHGMVTLYTSHGEVLTILDPHPAKEAAQ